jgi:hypothetical protein
MVTRVVEVLGIGDMLGSIRVVVWGELVMGRLGVRMFRYRPNNPSWPKRVLMRTFVGTKESLIVEGSTSQTTRETRL